MNNGKLSNRCGPHATLDLLENCFARKHFTKMFYQTKITDRFSSGIETTLATLRFLKS